MDLGLQQPQRPAAPSASGRFGSPRLAPARRARSHAAMTPRLFLAALFAAATSACAALPDLGRLGEIAPPDPGAPIQVAP